MPACCQYHELGGLPEISCADRYVVYDPVSDRILESGIVLNRERAAVINRQLPPFDHYLLVREKALSNLVDIEIQKMIELGFLQAPAIC